MNSSIGETSVGYRQRVPDLETYSRPEITSIAGDGNEVDANTGVTCETLSVLHPRSTSTAFSGAQGLPRTCGLPLPHPEWAEGGPHRRTKGGADLGLTRGAARQAASLRGGGEWQVRSTATSWRSETRWGEPRLV